MPIFKINNSKLEPISENKIDLERDIQKLPLSLNMYLFRNRPRKERPRKEFDSNNYIGYKNLMYLNQNLAKKQSWTKEDIEKRGEQLKSEAWNIFKMDWEK